MEQKNMMVENVQQATGALVVPGETAAMVLAAQAEALVKARFLVAMKNPRDLDVVREGILKECRRPGFAKVCRYKKPVGKKQDKDTGKWEQNFVEGPSIRYTEAALRNMRNVVIDTVMIYDDKDKRILRVQVSDIESNTTYNGDITVKKQLERSKTKEGDIVISKRKNSEGKDVFLIEATDEQILDKQNALISKMLRTLGLRIVPGDITEEAMDLAIKTEADADAADPLAAKKQLFDAFGKQGVSVSMLKEYLGHDGETLSPKEMQDLRATFNAIRDGETTWRDVMSDKPKPAAADSMKGKVNNPTGTDSDKPAEQTAPAADPLDEV